MLLTKECDYGVRIIRALSDNSKKKMFEICETENIPNQYAYKILKKLENAGFLQIERGRYGGYRLAKPLNTFTLFDIIASIDSNIFVSECLRNDRLCSQKVVDGKTCTVHEELERLQGLLISKMQEKTMDKVLSG